MKKLGIFLILALLLILLISCGKSTGNSSSVTNCTTSGTPSSVLPSSQTKPQDTETPITTTSQATETQVTSTSEATETQPISTSEAPQTEPTVIRSGFIVRGGLTSCPLTFAYEMPRSCPLSEETVTITLYFGIYETWYDPTSPEDYFKIYLWNEDRSNNESLSMYPLREVPATEISSQNYICTETRRDDGFSSRSFSHSETFEIPLSFFSNEKGDFCGVEVEFVHNNEFGGSELAGLSYEKINGETIVFYPHHIAKS